MQLTATTREYRNFDRAPQIFLRWIATIAARNAERRKQRSTRRILESLPNQLRRDIGLPPVTRPNNKNMVIW